MLREPRARLASAFFMKGRDSKCMGLDCWQPDATCGREASDPAPPRVLSLRRSPGEVGRVPLALLPDDARRGPLQRGARGGEHAGPAPTTGTMAVRHLGGLRRPRPGRAPRRSGREGAPPRRAGERRGAVGAELN